jgi:hypothetical protein
MQNLYLWYDTVCHQLDPTWLPFSNLMLQHIYNVLLICSDYDRFLWKKRRVRKNCTWNTPAGTVQIPRKITHTSDPAEALSL